MPTLPFGSLLPAVLRPVVQRGAGRHVVAQGPDRVVFPLPWILSGRLDDDPDPHATSGRPHQGVTHMRDAVDGVADEGDPLAGRIEHLEDGLLRVPVRGRIWVRGPVQASSIVCLRSPRRPR